MRHLLILLCCLWSSVAFAADLTLKNGDVLQGFMVIGSNAKGIQIAYKDGMVTVAPEQLPDDVRTTYAKFEKQYERAKAKAAKDAAVLAVKRKEAAAIAAQEAKLKPYTMMFYGKISQVGENGVLAYYNLKEFHDGLYRNMDEFIKNQEQIQEYFSTLSPKQQQIYQDALKKYDKSSDKVFARYCAFSDMKRDLELYKLSTSEPYYISDITGTDLVDGTIWHGKIYRIGTHKYTTVMGAGKTVAKYTASREKAIEFYGSQSAVAKSFPVD